jgi:hypothetical protein
VNQMAAALPLQSSNPFTQSFVRGLLRFRTISRVSWLIAISCVLLVLYLMMGVGRLHVGYVAVTLFGAYTRVSAVVAMKWWEIPWDLFRALGQNDVKQRELAQQAFQEIRPVFLSRFLVEQGEWRSQEQVDTLTADETAVLVAKVDQAARQRFVRNWFVLYAAVSIGFVVLLVWLEWQYATGRLHVESGWLGGR